MLYFLLFLIDNSKNNKAILRDVVFGFMGLGSVAG